MDTLLMRPHVFERGDRVYLTTPLTLATPTTAQVEEYAFASAVKSNAPNEHIGWLQGRYVEAGKANLNGAMWLSDELALKSLTPMLMPVTVMHDPRTAVGTIADCKLVSPEQAAQSTSRIDTILAIWKHRFGDIWAEAEHNIEAATMMQSMECLSPSYSCSDCGRQFIKLHEGKERASWCEHLQSNSSRRILEDVCFTGTGLIFGTRNGQGAYTEAHLDHFQDEIAEFHDRAHIDGTYTPKGARMGLVQIEDTELAALRSERDTAKSELSTAQDSVRDLTTKVETAEAATVTEKTRADAAEKANTDLTEKSQKAELASKRLGGLGSEFLAKLGEFTKARLTEAAASQSDEEWDATLKEKEELTGTERAAGEKGTGETGPAVGGPKKDKKGKENPTQGGGGSTSTAADDTAFSDEELAAFTRKGVAAEQRPAPTGNAARALARSMRPRPKTPAASAK